VKTQASPHPSRTGHRSAANPLALAAEVIRESSVEKPADALLRLKLKSARGWTSDERTEASQALFAFYRWFGWRDSALGLQAQITRALELSRVFRTKPEQFPDSDLLQRAIPDWIAAEMEVTAPWVQALQHEPRLWLRARPGQGGALAQELGDCKLTAASAETLEYVGNVDLFATAAFHAGKFEIQDISSQAVGLLCAPRHGETWWDACAGEGGKLLHLADQMQNKGLIWATDRASWRLARLKRRAARAQVFNYRSRQWKEGATLPTRTQFDGVLLDAPCSGVGTWQRNPHARWTTTNKDVRELAQLQIDLLRRVADSVKRGGRLIYAVCSLTRLETTMVRDKFERETPDFERLPLQNPLRVGASAEEEIWLWPQECGGNGMFVVGWRRR